MITNKDRKRFVPIALKNFKEQTYRNKKLIIINHSFDLDSCLGDSCLGGGDIMEIFVDKDKQKFTLGALRNIALAMVPFGEYWTTWDDDDYKHPDYLSQFMKRMIRLNLDILFLKNRLEVNLNNQFVFRSKFVRGWAFFVARKINEYKYLDLDTMEDTNVREVYEKAGKVVRIYNNDPKLYIRTIHTTNTSVFVNNEKAEIVQYNEKNHYQEFEATPEENSFVLKIINKYYL
jgi:hypothetical protein